MENEKKKKFTIQKMCMTAVFMALTCMATAFIQIPIPLGYAHLGDCIILIAAYLCGPVAGALAGGIGSAMADVITGFAIWALPTLLIKTIMPIIAYLLFRKMKITIGAAVSLFIYGGWICRLWLYFVWRRCRRLILSTRTFTKGCSELCNIQNSSIGSEEGRA